MSHWTINTIPDQTGRTIIVTGANSGLGFESALALARKGAHVIMASRSTQKNEAARAQILDQVPEASLDVMALDLASLQSIRDFVEAFTQRYDRLDILMNNAGVMAPPRRETADGFEMQFGVNHLGHFALTGLLLETLLKTPGSRVVTVSSNAQYMARINFDDLQGKKSYSRYLAYNQSKLANVLFAFELQRRLEAIGADTLSIPVHPGLVQTNLQTTTASASGQAGERLLYSILMPLFGQTLEEGVRPQLYAATMPDVRGGDHFAVAHLHMRGPARKVKAARAAYNEADARRLWEISEQLTGVTCDALKKDARVTV